MRQATFRFKRFAVLNDRAAMKVGTDGVLLGAWCPEPEGVEDRALRVLDVGTGSGLIALMLAQRCPTAAIDAIDIDPEAVVEARVNVANSPWAERIAVAEADFATMAVEAERYDVVVSNPPFFVGLQSPDARRAQARSSASLAPRQLVAQAAAMLRPGGRLAVVYPQAMKPELTALAIEHGLSVERVTDVATRPGLPPKRFLAAFRKGPVPAPLFDTLTLEAPDHTRSPQYAALTAAFYL